MSESTKRMLFELVKWGLAIVIGGAGWIYSVAGKSEQLNQNTSLVNDHEHRLRKLEQSQERLARIEEKVDWLQSYLRSGGTPR